MAIGKVNRSEALTAPLPKPRAIALPAQQPPAANPGTGRLGGDQRAVRSQTGPLEVTPEVNIQDIEVPGGLANGTTPKATSTSGGAQRPRRAETFASVEVDTRIQPVPAPALQAEVPRLQDYANGTTPRGSGSGGPQRPRSRETYSESLLDTSVT